MRTPGTIYAWVALGSALGGIARHGCTLLVGSLLGEAFPWGTILVNLLGSFVIGCFAALTGPDGRLLVPSEIRVFVMTGICGGYTTFSAFSLQTFVLLRGGEGVAAVANIGLSLLLCLIAVWLGDRAAARFDRLRGR